METIEQARLHISQLENKIAMLETTCCEHNKEKLKDLKDSVARLHGRIENTEKSSADTRTHLDHELDMLNHRLEVVDGLNSGHQRAINSLLETVAALRDLTAELKRESAQNKESNMELKSTVKEISNTLKQFVYMGAGMGLLIVLIISGTVDKFIKVSTEPAPIHQEIKR